MNPKHQAAAHQQRRARHHASTLDAHSLLELLNNPALSDQVNAAMPPHGIDNFHHWKRFRYSWARR